MSTGANTTQVTKRGVNRTTNHGASKAHQWKDLWRGQEQTRTGTMGHVNQEEVGHTHHLLRIK